MMLFRERKEGCEKGRNKFNFFRKERIDSDTRSLFSIKRRRHEKEFRSKISKMKHVSGPFISRISSQKSLTPLQLMLIRNVQKTHQVETTYYSWKSESPNNNNKFQHGKSMLLLFLSFSLFQIQQQQKIRRDERRIIIIIRRRRRRNESENKRNTTTPRSSVFEKKAVSCVKEPARERERDMVCPMMGQRRCCCCCCVATISLKTANF